jgi:hypothetical protein
MPFHLTAESRTSSKQNEFKELRGIAQPEPLGYTSFLFFEQ